MKNSSPKEKGLKYFLDLAEKDDEIKNTRNGFIQRLTLHANTKHLTLEDLIQESSDSESESGESCNTPDGANDKKDDSKKITNKTNLAILRENGNNFYEKRVEGSSLYFSFKQF